MSDRHRDTIRRRSSVLDKDQTGQTDVDTGRAKYVRRDRPLRKLIPFLIFLVFAFLIAREEIPAVSDAWERLVAPDNWQAQQVCQQAAIARSEYGKFSRVLKRGRVNRTNDGMYIDRLVIGEMGPSGDEIRVEYSCYVGSDGNLVKLNSSEASN